MTLPPLLFSVCRWYRRRILPVWAAMLLLAPGRLYAQPLDTSARSGALAGATVALAGALIPYPNPASLARLQAYSVSFFASQGFSLPALRFGAATVAIPLRTGGGALQAQSFGTERYRESHFTVALAKALHPGSTRPLYAGLAVEARVISIASYGARAATRLHGGILVEIWPSVYAGTAFSHPVRRGGPVRLPTRMQAGLSFEPAPGVWLMAAVDKEQDFPAALHAGVEVRASPALRLQTGVATVPDRWAAGLDVTLGPLTAGLAGERHEALGWTPAVSIDLRLGRRKTQP